MNMEQQVVSLELASKLKDLGVEQNSLFYWVEHIQTSTTTDFVLATTYLNYKNTYYLDDTEPVKRFDGSIMERKPEVNSVGCDCCSMSWKVKNKYSAYTVAELGELLPQWISTGMFNGQQTFGTLIMCKHETKDNNQFVVGFTGKELIQFKHEKEADARALTLIKIMEAGKFNYDDIKVDSIKEDKCIKF